jgi:hypothetical protein
MERAVRAVFTGAFLAGVSTWEKNGVAPDNPQALFTDFSPNRSDLSKKRSVA